MYADGSGFGVEQCNLGAMSTGFGGCYLASVKCHWGRTSQFAVLECQSVEFRFYDYTPLPITSPAPSRLLSGQFLWFVPTAGLASGGAPEVQAQGGVITSCVRDGSWYTVTTAPLSALWPLQYAAVGKQSDVVACLSTWSTKTQWTALESTSLLELGAAGARLWAFADGAYSSSGDTFDKVVAAARVIPWVDIALTVPSSADSVVGRWVSTYPATTIDVSDSPGTVVVSYAQSGVGAFDRNTYVQYTDETSFQWALDGVTQAGDYDEAPTPYSDVRMIANDPSVVVAIGATAYAVNASRSGQLTNWAAPLNGVTYAPVDLLPAMQASGYLAHSLAGMISGASYGPIGNVRLSTGTAPNVSNYTIRSYDSVWRGDKGNLVLGSTLYGRFQNFQFDII